MGNFIRENILPLFSLVFPLVMLSQFFINTVLKLIAKPKLAIYPAGAIEIGFSDFGPTVTLFGTLQTTRKDAFVTEIRTTVQHVESDTTHALTWRVFKPYTFGLHPNRDTIQFEPVSAFLLQVAAPFKYNTIFVDDEFVAAQLGQAEAVVDSWGEYQESAAADQPHAAGALVNTATTASTPFEVFYRQPQIQQIAHHWQEQMYWQAGTYQLTIHVDYGPETVQSSTYRFTLTAEDIATLQDNAKLIIANLVDQSVRYKRIQVEYSAV